MLIFWYYVPGDFTLIYIYIYYNVQYDKGIKVNPCATWRRGVQLTARRADWLIASRNTTSDEYFPIDFAAVGVITRASTSPAFNDFEHSKILFPQKSNYTPELQLEVIQLTSSNSQPDYNNRTQFCWRCVLKISAREKISIFSYTRLSRHLKKKKKWNARVEPIL